MHDSIVKCFHPCATAVIKIKSAVLLMLKFQLHTAASRSIAFPRHDFTYTVSSLGSLLLTPSAFDPASRPSRAAGSLPYPYEFPLAPPS